jgi:hypothetical protein
MAWSGDRHLQNLQTIEPKKTLQMQGYIQQSVLSHDNKTLEVRSKLYTEISVSITWDLVAKTITTVTRKILLVS